MSDVCIYILHHLTYFYYIVIIALQTYILSYPTSLTYRIYGYKISTLEHVNKTNNRYIDDQK